jgi:hypothetical protein
VKLEILLKNKAGIGACIVLLLALLQGCTKKQKFEDLVGHPVVWADAESGARFRREYYVYSKNGTQGESVFELICSKVSSEFGSRDSYDPGTLQYEKNKFGSPPDIPAVFDREYASNLNRHFSLRSKDRLSVVEIYETEKYVCVVLADGS